MKTQNRRVLVTGGCGFIGSYLVDILVERGDRPIVVDSLFHSSYPHIAHLAGRIDHRKVSIVDRVALDEVFAETRPQDVYHLAAHHFIPYCDNHPVDAMEVNILGTQIVADLCKKHDVEKLFIASTAAVYGISDKPHVETEVPDPVDVYGLTKYADERIAFFLSRKSDVKVRVGRYFNAVGRRETNPHIIPEILNQLSANLAKPVLHLGNVFPKRDYIHAADLAHGSFTVLNTPTPEDYDVVNIGSGLQYSVSEIVDLFAKELRVPIEIQTDPSKLRKADRSYLCANTTKLAGTYGWSPRFDLPDTVRDLAALLRPEIAAVPLPKVAVAAAGHDLPVVSLK